MLKFNFSNSNFRANRNVESNSYIISVPPARPLEINFINEDTDWLTTQCDKRVLAEMDMKCKHCTAKHSVSFHWCTIEFLDRGHKKNGVNRSNL